MSKPEKERNEQTALPDGRIKVPPELQPLVKEMARLELSLNTARASSKATAGTLEILSTDYMDVARKVTSLAKMVGMRNELEKKKLAENTSKKNDPKEKPNADSEKPKKDSEKTKKKS